jgi:hypothetical protein
MALALVRLYEQLEAAQKREEQAEREAAALLETMKAREGVIDRLRLELAEARRASNPAKEPSE